MASQLIQSESFELLPERSRVDLKQKLTEIVAFTNALAVDNEINFRRVTAMYAQSKEWEKLIEFTRKQANAPDQERINARNDKAKEILVPLRQIQTIAKAKSAEYQEHLEELKRKEEEESKAAIALLELEETPYYSPAETTQRGDGASAYTRIVKRFKVTDLNKVPREYLRLDEDAIETAIKMGVAEIAGVEIYDEKITTLRSR